MTDLTDRMRTCAAHLCTVEVSEILTDDQMEAIIDARNLLLKGADAIELAPVAIEAIEKLTEQPGPVLPATIVFGDPPPQSAETWYAPGDPLPTKPFRPRTCPRCGSRGNMQTRIEGNMVMLRCRTCSHEWPFAVRAE